MLEARAEASSPWFQGHFPGEPILPGIAQIAIVWDAIRKALPDEAANILEVKRLRFRHIIRPDDVMRVEIVRDSRARGSFTFKITVRGGLACNGVLVAGDHGPKGR